MSAPDRPSRSSLHWQRWLLVLALVILVWFVSSRYSTEIRNSNAAPRAIMPRGDLADLWIWLRHLAGCTVILWFVVSVAGMPWWPGRSRRSR